MLLMTVLPRLCCARASGKVRKRRAHTHTHTHRPVLFLSRCVRADTVRACVRMRLGARGRTDGRRVRAVNRRTACALPSSVSGTGSSGGGSASAGLKSANLRRHDGFEAPRCAGLKHTCGTAMRSAMRSGERFHGTILHGTVRFGLQQESTPISRSSSVMMQTEELKHHHTLLQHHTPTGPYDVIISQ